MTKDHKTSNARETVYDRCAYVGCYNGKFINGRRLFHFPAETDRRLEMWIERSGNFRLRTWAATSLRKAGICGDHFDDKSFTNATKKALRRNVVPRHYTEDFKYRKANNENAEKNKNTKNNSGSGEEDDPISCDRLSPYVESSGKEKHCSNEKRDESSLQPSEYFLTHDIKKSPARSPSPVVEFIVEELDESLVCDETEANVEKSIYYEEEGNEDHNEVTHDALFESSSMSMEETEEHEETEETHESTPAVTGLTVNRSNSDVRTYYRSKNHPPASADGLIRVKLELQSEDSQPLTEDENTAFSTTSSVLQDTSHDWGNRQLEKTVLNLREENQMLKKKMRLLKQNLRRAKDRETKYMKTRDLLNNVDEFLNIQECDNLVARAMVKLALHKNRIPYSKEERDFATQLYRHSPAAFIRLRRAGCNFPGKNTMKRWIAEDDSEPSSFNFMDADENDDTAEEGGDDIDEGDDEMLIEILNEQHGLQQHDEHNEVEGTNEEDDNMDNVVEGVESTDNMNDAVEDAEEAIDDLVEHLEVVIDHSEGQDGYVQVFAPEDDEEDDFK